MLTTKESAASPSSSRAATDSEDEATSDGGGEMEEAPDGERAGDEVGERPSPTTVESAEDLQAKYIPGEQREGIRLGFTQPMTRNIASEVKSYVQRQNAYLLDAAAADDDDVAATLAR